MQQEFSLEVLKRLPLAEAVLRLWQWIDHTTTLDDLFDRNRGGGYQGDLKFSVMVNLIHDALLEFQGSGRKSFQHARQHNRMPVSDQAAYEKLRNLPATVSEAFLAESSDCLVELVPITEGAQRPDTAGGLQEFSVVIFDGKATKKIPKRLKPLRNSQGGIVGGKGLVALEMWTGLVIAMSTDEDGDANDSRLLPDLLPMVHRRRDKILWVGDRQFGDPKQIALLSERDVDRYILRFHAKTPFYPDTTRPTRTGTDHRGREYREEWGWLGNARNKHRCYVRRITLYREGEENIIVVTNLLDGDVYPAVDILDVYLQRWGIERVFQTITEVFSLIRFIGTTPRGTLFQLSFCLLLYNMVQLIRTYVAEGANMPVAEVSTELLFDDVRRQQIALHEMLPPPQIIEQLKPPLATAEHMRTRLSQLLHPLYTKRWRKAPAKKHRPPANTKKKREHASAHRILQQHRQTSIKDKLGRK